MTEPSPNQTDQERISGSERVRRIADGLQKGERPPTVSVRDFLSWFGAARRGQWIVSGIRQSIDNAGIVTKPDFEEAFIDAPLSFALASANDTEKLTDPVSVESGSVDSEHSAVPATAIDPTYRLSRLKAANTPPVWVNPDKSLVEAITLMLNHDFSQLPVMTNEKSVKGMVSWRSIGARWALDRPGELVRDFMDEHYEVSSDRSLFAALPIIVEQGYVLIRDTARGRISGIVTTSDLSLQFQQLAEPFLLLGEIENHIRRLMYPRFTIPELAQARDPGDVSRTIARVADLSFGEYLRFLGDPARWAKLGLPIDRALFLRELDRVRVIRNEVMHFDPDPLAPADLETLRRVSRFLQSLHALGV